MGDVLECILFFCFIIFIASLFIESVLLPYWYICVPAAAVLALAWALPRLLRRRKAGRIRRVEAQIRACVEPLRMDILPFLSLLGQAGEPSPEYARMCRKYEQYRRRELRRMQKLNRKAERLGIRKRVPLPPAA